MADTVADVLLARLREWGVRQVFGYAGDGINGLLAAWGRAENDPQFVQARHEEMAAFEAVGFAKFSGEVGVCTATSGPGAIHLLNGLYDAKLDHVPGVAIVGQTEQSAMGGSYQQEVDLLSLFKDVCSAYVQVCTVPQQLPNLIDRAIRIAQAERTPTCVIFPSDVFDLPYEPPAHAFKMVPSSLGTNWPSVHPDPAGLRLAADILNAGQKVAVLVGQGARGCVDELTELSELLGAGVAKALLGKDVLPDTLPFVTGAIGLLGTEPSWELMQGCDTLLMIGTGFPWAEFLPKDEKVRAVQIDVDPSMLSLRFPAEVNLHGDALETLRLLLPLLQRKSDRSWRAGIESGMGAWWHKLEERAKADANPVNPQRVVWEMSPLLPADAIVTSDSGSCANWYARDFRIKRGQSASLSGGLASMGAAVPYAIAAKFAHPSRPVVALVGDGAMQMNNMAELITIQKYWQRWSDPRLIVCVFNNGDLNEVTWEQRVMEGNPRYATTQDLPNVPYAQFAELLGLKGIYVDTPDALGLAWADALAADRPVVLEVKTDPEV